MVWQHGCLITLGLTFATIGILVKLGHLRSHWFVPFSYYRDIVYGLIPLGIAIVIIGIGPLFYDTVWIIFLRVLVIILTLLGIFMWLFKPRFAQPNWLNWLEDNHSDVLPELRYELRKLGRRRKEIIQNQTTLETWIEQFRHQRR